MRNGLACLSVLCLLGLPVGTALAADGEYLYDTLAKPAYGKAWDRLMKAEKNLPAWLAVFRKTSNGVASPVKSIAVDGKTYLSGYVCKPHDCASNHLQIFFGENAAGAAALLVQEGKPRYLGGPDAAIKAALDRAIKE